MAEDRMIRIARSFIFSIENFDMIDLNYINFDMIDFYIWKFWIGLNFELEL